MSTAAESGSVQGILRLGNAFCEAQALFTAVELDVFTAHSRRCRHSAGHPGPGWAARPRAA